MHESAASYSGTVPGQPAGAGILSRTFGSSLLLCWLNELQKFRLALSPVRTQYRSSRNQISVELYKHRVKLVRALQLDVQTDEWRPALLLVYKPTLNQVIPLFVLRDSPWVMEVRSLSARNSLKRDS